MEETISLKELFNTLKKRMAMIITITLLAVSISALVSYFLITPVYQSTTQLLVNQEQTEQPNLNVSDIQANLQLINTYNVIIKSARILDKVSDEMDGQFTAGQLNEKITVQTERDSQVVNLSVQDPDPYVAADIANKTAAVFQEDVVGLMSVDNVNVLTPAVVTPSQSPVSPQPFLNMAIALVVGLMVGVGVAFLLEYLDNTIKTEQDIEKTLDLPILGVIGQITDLPSGDISPGRSQATEVRSERYGS
ncbi:YveK family protein [Jeotgalibacillus proteolyticus]|uniref:Capsular biosynthesis protein n=1 Tax=Jeotgalibacillus proteolyticus TaxID=2082395 RepID=A0A2S5GBK2_9BACL|nr:Wzz/FepE/Etk N-terminal domain-containing protein [Jeotgalibacillus proteolyticus]PPA70295.1 capsular biosynthesis protein [Jeotgalibacillus proteolyticus]